MADVADALAQILAQVLDLAFHGRMGGGCREKRNRKHASDGKTLRHPQPNPFVRHAGFPAFGPWLAESPSDCIGPAAIEQVLALSQRRISATLTWLLCHVKLLILFNIIYALHRGITGLVSFCCAFRDQKKRARLAAGPSFSAVRGYAYFAVTRASDLSTCWSGESLSSLEDRVAMILPSLPIT